MKNLILLPFLVLFIPVLGARDPDYWGTQTLFGEMAVVLWLSFEVGKRVHLLASIPFFYFASYAVYCTHSFLDFTVMNPDKVPLNLQPLFEKYAAHSTIFLLLCTLPFIFLKRETLSQWLCAFKTFAFLNCFYMIYQYHFGPIHYPATNATGRIGMDSVDGTFVALTIPLFLFSNGLSSIKKFLLLLLIGYALYLTKSSTVFGVICLQIAVYLYFYFKKNKKALVAAIVACLIAIPIGKAWLGRDLLDPNGRQDIHKLTWNIYKVYTDKAFGLGTGSFLTIMPELQHKNDKKFFIWLHNEPVQILFEQGIIGLCLLILMILFLTYKNRDSLPLTMLTVTTVAQSFFQPSTRYFIFALFIAFVTRFCFELKPETILMKGDLS